MEEAGCVSPWDAAGALLLAEAVNWAAKVIDGELYALKGLAICAAVECGAELYWGDDGTVALYAPRAGAATFHDPHGDVAAALRARGHRPMGYLPWSGISRQELAFELLANPAARRLVALRTDPRFAGRPVLAGPAGRLP